MHKYLNWYKKAMALDPNAWKGEANPARLRQHQDVVRTPWGKIQQKQNELELEEKYSGVHLALSAEQAALYAEGKARKDDPPVLIEIYKQDLPAKMDVDAEVDQSIIGYLDDKSDWNKIFNSSQSDEEKSDLILDKLEGDKDFWEGDNEINEDAADAIASQNTTIPPVSILNYLRQNFSDSSSLVQAMQSIVNGNIPEQLVINTVGQFRVMHPIVSERIKAIYIIPWVNLEADTNMTPYEMSDEQLEENGWRKDAEGDVVDEEGRKCLSYDDILYESWLSMQPIYQDKHQNLPGMQLEEDTVWHGTTLSRAKQAFPDLIGSYEHQIEEELEDLVEASSLNWYKTAQVKDTILGLVDEDGVETQYADVKMPTHSSLRWDKSLASATRFVYYSRDNILFSWGWLSENELRMLVEHFKEKYGVEKFKMEYPSRSSR